MSDGTLIVGMDVCEQELPSLPFFTCVEDGFLVCLFHDDYYQDTTIRGGLMANEEQLAILKQGVDVWNKWRRANPKTRIDLEDALLNGLDLSNANLAGADLAGTDFSYSNLYKVDLSQATLRAVDLIEANLKYAHLKKTNLSLADLSNANLNQAYLGEANLRQATVGGTIFANIDLSQTMELEKVFHISPSIVDSKTLQYSKGKIPTIFLRGCGMSDFEIESEKLHNPDLSNQEINNILYKIYDLRAHQSIQISPLFISYSHADAAFVDRLEADLNEKGIRFWRDIHDAKAGRLEKQIEQAIRHNPTVLLILSKSSLQSDWVQHEVRKARGLEKELGRDVLCPVALDGSWKKSNWPERVMEQVMEYHILDFSKWEDDKVFEKMFVKLLDGLQLFYKG